MAACSRSPAGHIEVRNTAPPGRQKIILADHMAIAIERGWPDMKTMRRR